jgi:hypothetical protein
MTNKRITGVGQFSLPSRAYNTTTTEHGIQLTETAVINKTIVNETRFQFDHNDISLDADNSTPTIDVQEAFTGGGSQAGQTHTVEKEWELTNNTSFAMGPHSFKTGARVRGIHTNQFSPQNFGGTYSFFGGAIPSIVRYQTTIVGLEEGLSPAEIRLLGGGASQFRLAAG